MLLTNEDRKWLALNYPLLKIERSSPEVLIIKGMLNFAVYFDKEKDQYQYTFKPTDVLSNEKYRISDSYEITIISSPPQGNTLPIVVETGDRILSLAKNQRLRLCDLHIDEKGRCCLFPKPFDKIRYPKGIGIQEFIYDLVIPFFYGQSFFGKYGYWPAGTYSHEDLGILEYYAELASESPLTAEMVDMFFNSLSRTTQKLITDSMLISRQWECLCGMGTKFRNCHPKAMNGLKQLKIDYDRYVRKQQA